MFLFRFIILIIFVNEFTAYTPESYCKLPCENRNKATHIACERKSMKCGPDPSCKGFVAATFSNAERIQILDKHNELRNKIAMGQEKGQPKAANMRELKYDMELEYIASCNANACKFKHDNCRRTANFISVGQNLALDSQSVKFHPSEYIVANLRQIGNWFNEVKHMTLGPLKTFHLAGPVIGHYTQLVWAEIEFVGCARSVYYDKGWYNVYLVCNYGGKNTGGNRLSSPVYQIGSPCTKCPANYKCLGKWPGLCTSTDNRYIKHNISTSKPYVVPPSHNEYYDSEYGGEYSDSGESYYVYPSGAQETNEGYQWNYGFPGIFRFLGF